MGVIFFLHKRWERAKLLIMIKKKGETHLTFKLQDFEGPLDLLLYLIEKNKMNIYDIEIASITTQYMQYLEAEETLELDQMSDFIVMAATLLYMKSRLLLPKPKKEHEEPEEDIRLELVQKLLEYKKVKYISQKLEEYQESGQQHFFRNQTAHLEIKEPTLSCEMLLDKVTLNLLYDTFKQLVQQQKLEKQSRQNLKLDATFLEKESYTIEQQSQYIKQAIQRKGQVHFFELCQSAVTKLEIVVTFMAILELVHKREIDVLQEAGKIIMKEVS